MTQPDLPSVYDAEKTRPQYSHTVSPDLYINNPEYFSRFQPRIHRDAHIADDQAVQCQIDLLGIDHGGSSCRSANPQAGNLTALRYSFCSPMRLATISYLIEASMMAKSALVEGWDIDEPACKARADHDMHRGTGRLASSLSGKTLHVPNLKEVTSEWPRGTHPNLHELRSSLDEMLATLTDDDETSSKHKACDYALLTAVGFPSIEWPELKCLAAGFAWSFIFDDEMDEGDTEISITEKLAQTYILQALEYIRWCLGLNNCEEPECQIRSMSLFKEFGHFLRDTLDIAQRERLLREIQVFMSQVLVEQGQRRKMHAQSVEKYLQMRHGTIGVTSFLTAVCEFANRIELPRWIFDSQEMKTIWKDMETLTIIINDVYSLKKEMVKDGIHQNIIPVMLSRNKNENLSDIMHELVQQMRASMASLDSAHELLRRKIKDDTALDNDLRVYVDNCRTAVTGFNDWTLASKRYGLREYLQEDGSLIIPF